MSNTPDEIDRILFLGIPESTANYEVLRRGAKKAIKRHISREIRRARIKDTQMWIDSTKYKEEKVVLLRHLEVHLKELEE